jgi:MYXO-CTERM domain-containing protein
MTMRWPRIALSICALAASLFMGSELRAETTPIPGAVSFPNSVALSLPFPAGASVQIIAGYGPAMGSSFHQNTDAGGSANDHYALDLVYAAEANFGKGLPVVTPLAGTVVRSGWATGGWSPYGQRVILQHDLGDGHVYHSIYCHLDSIDPTIVEGATVVVGQALGALGQSCENALSCSNFSTPHLHWALHRNSLVGGSGTGGSYGGNAVVPEPLDGAEDLLAGTLITSTTTGMAICGDGVCSSGEDHGSCPRECPPCTLLPAAGGVIDESETACFTRSGTPAFWTEEAIGYDDSLIWTTATDGPEVDNSGRWALAFSEAGDYQLDIYTDTEIAQSQSAQYTVVHAEQETTATLNQSAADGWRPLGTFFFGAGGEQQIRLDDVTGEPAGEARRLVFDAIRLTRVDGQGGAGGASSTGAGASASSSTAAGGGPSNHGDDNSPSGGGCGCRVGARPRSPSAWLLLAGLLVISSRRRR